MSNEFPAPILDESQLIRADWPAPAHVHAWVTTRAGGVSQAPFDALNVGLHVDDDRHAVLDNRRRLTAFCQARGSQGALPWLNQVHGITVINDNQWPTADCAGNEPRCIDADASSTAQAGRALVVMTADCLPVFFTDSAGSRVALAHAGWRGLCAGIIEATAATFAPSQTLMAWLGPAIGSASFEVGDSVRMAFLDNAQAYDVTHAAGRDDEQRATHAAFVATRPGHYLADLYALARLRLLRVGVSAVYGGNFDTYSESSRFFSYRRVSRTGRMASVIWRT